MPTKNVQINTGKDIKLVILVFLRNSLQLLLPMQGTWVRSLGWEDPLEKEMVTHSSILAWRIPWTEEPGRLQSTGSQRVGHDWATSLHFTSLTLINVYAEFIFFSSLINSFHLLPWAFVCMFIHRFLSSAPQKRTWIPISVWSSNPRDSQESSIAPQFEGINL